MKSTPTSDGSAKPSAIPWRWWLFPIFWALVFCIGLALSILSLYARHPERLNGWGGAGLGVLLVGNFGVFMLLAWEWLYRARPVETRRGLIIFAAQMLLLLPLIWWYGSAFAWICLALFYPVIGGLPRRQWPLPLAVLLLVFIVGSLLADSAGEASAASMLNSFLQIVVNLGIAVGLRVISTQRDQLSTALEQLRQAHGELAASAGQKEELAVLRERARLARAMHDNLGHALVRMNVKLEAAQLLYARDAVRGDDELEATRALIRTTMAELRRTLADLRTPAADPADLAAALDRLTREMQARTGVDITCRITPDLPLLPAETRETIWYVAREALANVERHAAATSATLSVEHLRDSWLLRVVDDGLGVRASDLRRPEHYGVVGMRERMKGIG